MHLNIVNMWHQMVKHLARTQYQAKEQPQPVLQKLWTRDFCSISLLNLLIFVGGNMLVTTFPFYIKSLGGTELTVGITAGIYSLLALLMRPIAGWLLDNKSRKAIFLIGLVGAMLFPMLYLVFPLLSVVILLRAMHGFLWSAAGTASNTNACDIVPQSRFAEGMGFFGLTNSLAMAISPAIGLWIMEGFGFTPLFFSCSVFSLVAVLLLARIRLYDPPHPRRKSGSLPLKARLASLFSKEALPASWLFFFCMLPGGSIASFIALYAEAEGLGNGGIYFTFQALFTGLFRVFGGRVADKHGEKVAVYYGCACFFISLAGLAAAKSAAFMYASSALFGIGYGLTLPSFQAMALRTVPWERRGSASSTYLCFFDMSWGLGGVLGGVFSDAFGYRVMFALMSLGLVLCVLTYVLWARKTPSAFDEWQKRQAPAAAAAAK